MNRIFDAAVLGWLGIRCRPARAALSAVGVALGVAILVLVVAIPAGGQADLERRLTDLGTDVLKVAVNQVSNGGDGAAASDAGLPVEAAAMVRRVGPVRAAAAAGAVDRRVKRTEFADPNDTAAITVLATEPALLDTVHARMARGRFLDRVDDGLPTLVLGADAAGWLGLSDSDVGDRQRVLVGDRWMAVIGVLAPTPLTPELGQAALVSAETAHRLLGYDRHPDGVYLRAVESKLGAVAAVLPSTVDPALPGLVSVSRPSAALAAKLTTRATFSGLFLGLAGVALLVGGIGIANTMVVSVLERRREIGLRRALGARQADIRRQFVLEAILLSSIGGVVGALLGAAGGFAYSGWRGWPVQIPLPVTAAGVGGAVLVGALAGLYPAVRASLVSPTTALASP